MKLTALGVFIGIVPFGQQHTTWYVVGFGKSGQMRATGKTAPLGGCE